MPRELPGSPLGLHRVIEPAGALPQAAWRLDPSPELWPDETRVRVDRLNLDAASFRQLTEAAGGDPDKLRAAVLGIVAERGKMQNPETGSGGMLTGVVHEAGPAALPGRAAEVHAADQAHDGQCVRWVPARRVLQPVRGADRAVHPADRHD